MDRTIKISSHLSKQKIGRYCIHLNVVLDSKHLKTHKPRVLCNCVTATQPQLITFLANLNIRNPQ